VNNPAAIATVVVLIVMLVALGVVLNFVGLWTRALVSGAHVELMSLIGMRLRRVDAREVINARIQLCRADLRIDVPLLESHVLAGGDLRHVVNAVVAAKMGGKELPWDSAAAMDLAGRDVVEYVKSGAHERGQDWKQAPRRRPARDMDRMG
jgi:uncharacterized protein YqfA (UPF0365 family)